MRRSRPSLRDVAAAGCSVGAASVVLIQSRANIGVSDETRARIREAAAELRYQRNAAATALRRGSFTARARSGR